MKLVVDRKHYQFYYHYGYEKRKEKRRDNEKFQGHFIIIL